MRNPRSWWSAAIELVGMMKYPRRAVDFLFGNAILGSHVIALTNRSTEEITFKIKDINELNRHKFAYFFVVLVDLVHLECRKPVQASTLDDFCLGSITRWRR